MIAEETTLDKIRTRPRFKLFTDETPDKISEKLADYVKIHNEEFFGNINKEVANIQVKTPENPYWKPYLAIRTEKEGEKTVVRGIFGPSSAVWTFFMFLYFIFGILWMVFITMWFVTKQIGSTEFPWALTASFLMLAAIAGTYFGARIGQKKAKEEMQKLRQFAEEAILSFEKTEN